MTASGLDVSNHQGPGIDWPAVADGGYRFAYLKASEGGTFTDADYRHNHAGALRAGLAVGLYHYARPDNAPGDAQREATRFAGLVGRLSPGDLPPALDLEDHGGLNPDKLNRWALDFLVTLSELCPGRLPIVYTFPSFLTDRLQGAHTVLRLYPLWWARYAPRLSVGDPHALIWQHSAGGTVPGVPGRVDVNRFLGTELELSQLAGRAAGPVHRPAWPAPGPHISPTVHTPEGPAVHIVNLTNANSSHLVTGPGVRALQALLIAGGFLAGPIDSRAGAGTRAGLLHAQRHYGLAQDAIAGAGTFGALIGL